MITDKQLLEIAASEGNVAKVSELMKRGANAKEHNSLALKNAVIGNFHGCAQLLIPKSNVKAVHQELIEEDMEDEAAWLLMVEEPFRLMKKAKQAKPEKRKCSKTI